MLLHPLSGRGGTGGDDFVDALLDPSAAFHHPRDVVADPELTLNEKRALLAAWASDACAVESTPAKRKHPIGGPPVDVDEILEALRELDKRAVLGQETARLRNQVRRQRIERFREKRSRSDHQGGQRG